MLEITGLSFRYKKSAPPVLDGLSAGIGDGGITVLLGKNGSGKTTLFKILTGSLKPQSGTVLFDGEDLLGMPPSKRAARVAYVPQETVYGDMTVCDTVLSARASYVGVRPSKRDRDAVCRALERMNLLSLSGRRMTELSGGERQKAAIARALAQEARLIVFDEPTGNLDIANEWLTAREMKRLSREAGVSILTSIHDPQLALALGDRFLILKNGKADAYGCADDLTGEVLSDCFDTPVRIVEYEGHKIIVKGEPL